MTRKIFICMSIVFLLFVGTFTPANAQVAVSEPVGDGEPVSVDPEPVEPVPTSCTVMSYCYNWLGQIVGSVSCTGRVCSRGSEWVKCDGVKTEC